jgi:hypothetical protein
MIALVPLHPTRDRAQCPANDPGCRAMRPVTRRWCPRPPGAAHRAGRQHRVRRLDRGCLGVGPGGAGSVTCSDWYAFRSVHRVEHRGMHDRELSAPAPAVRVRGDGQRVRMPYSIALQHPRRPRPGCVSGPAATPEKTRTAEGTDSWFEMTARLCRCALHRYMIDKSSCWMARRLRPEVRSCAALQRPKDAVSMHRVSLFAGPAAPEN